MNADEQRTVRWALWSWAGYCRARASEIAQDRHGRLRDQNGKPIPTASVGAALNEAARAEALIPQFRGDSK